MQCRALDDTRAPAVLARALVSVRCGQRTVMVIFDEVDGAYIVDPLYVAVTGACPAPGRGPEGALALD